MTHGNRTNREFINIIPVFIPGVFSLFYHIPEGEKLPAEITWTDNAPKGKVRILANGKSVKAVTVGNRTTVRLPKGLAQEPVAMEFKIK